MSDRHVGYVVTLDHDMHEEDSTAVVKAISMIKHVVSVKPLVADFSELMARERVTHELTQKFWEILHPELKK